MTLQESRDHVERAIRDVARAGYEVMWDRYIDRLIIGHMTTDTTTKRTRWVETTIDLDQ